jgi:fucose permease
MSDSPARRTVWTGYASVLALGVYISALGPGLPAIAARTHEPLAQAGTLFTALFSGGLATSAIAGRLMDRIGRRPVYVAGILSNGAGLAALALATSWPEALVAAFFVGVGDAVVAVGSHVLFTDLYPDGIGAALNRLNVFFGIGALSGPALAGFAILALGSVRAALFGVAALQALIALSLLRAPVPAQHGHAAGSTEGWRILLPRPLLWLLGGVIVAYVGLEVGLGDWAYSYLRAGGFGVAAASVSTSGYWLMLALGRAFCPLLLRRHSDLAVLRLATAGAAAAATMLVLVAVARPAGTPFLWLLGFCFGPIWPLTFALGAAAFPRGFGAVSGLLTTCGAIGGLGGPWLQGLLLHVGARQGMAFTLAGCAAMVALVALAARRSATEREAEAACASTS